MSWSSFIGFVPAEEPVLLCGIMIDEPENHEMGGVAAAPAFKKIMSQIISHPELAYTQEILKKNSIPVPKKKVVQDTIPSVCGMIKIQAQQRLDSMGIRYRFSGTGNKIVYQTPLAGGESDQSVDMVLFLDSSDKHTGSSTEIPQCVGKDLRDAVNMINLKGLKPFAIGSGTVHRQSPAGGAMMRIAETCTLFCSFGG
jgi:hypothetical protein